MGLLLDEPGRNRRHSAKLLFLVAGVSLVFMAGCSATQVQVPPVTDNSTNQVLAGKFIWHDLVSEDAQKARTFYGNLFGWTFGTSQPDYMVIKHNGSPIGGIATQESKDPGSPEAIWLVSMSVADLDQALGVVKARGGKVLEGPETIAGHGRAAVIEDPTGALLMLLQADGGDPPDAKPVTGGWAWTDLFTNDLAASKTFYEALAGYELKDVKEGEDHVFHVLYRDGKARGGIVEMTWENVEPNWIPYVKVADIKKTIEQAKKLGGTLLIQAGKIAIIADPSGGVFGVQQL